MGRWSPYNNTVPSTLADLGLACQRGEPSLGLAHLSFIALVRTKASKITDHSARLQRIAQKQIDEARGGGLQGEDPMKRASFRDSDASGARLTLIARSKYKLGEEVTYECHTQPPDNG